MGAREGTRPMSSSRSAVYASCWLLLRRFAAEIGEVVEDLRRRRSGFFDTGIFVSLSSRKRESVQPSPVRSRVGLLIVESSRS